MGVWESEEEPWIYAAVAMPSRQATHRFAPADVEPSMPANVDDLHPKLRELISGQPIVSAGFRTENLSGRVYFGGGERRKSQQVVLEGHVGSRGAVVKWAIRREARRPSESVATGRAELRAREERG